MWYVGDVTCRLPYVQDERELGEVIRSVIKLSPWESARMQVIKMMDVIIHFNGR
jgi:hypothetical protein